MEAQILIIAPYAELLEDIKEVIADKFFEEQLKFRLLEADTVAAKNLLKKDAGYEVILTCGVVAAELREANISLPVVDIPVLGMDVVQAILKADGIAAARQIGIVGFAAMLYSAENLHDFVGMPYREIILENRQDAAEKIKAAKMGGVEMMVGDATAVKIAKELGMPSHAITFGKQSLYQALREAVTLANAIQARDSEGKREQATAAYSASDLVGVTADALHRRELMERYAGTTLPILISGEVGTGKTLAARIIHAMGGGAANACHLLDCLTEAPWPQETFALGTGETLLLRRVEALTLSRQAELMEHLAKLSPGIRVIATASRPLSSMVAQGEFLPELYYFLATLPLHLPPLEMRREDIPPLAAVLLRDSSSGKGIKKIAPEAESHLQEQPWPGNIHELKSVLSRAAVFAVEDTIDLAALTTALEEEEIWEGAKEEGGHNDTAASDLKAVENETMQRVLAEEDYNYTRAAKRLGIHRTTLWRKLKNSSEAGTHRP